MPLNTISRRSIRHRIRRTAQAHCPTGISSDAAGKQPNATPKPPAKSSQRSSGASENSSFDPADYILPSDTEESLPYRLLIEIDQADDEQASLVYGVDIDNAAPRTYQLLDLVGYPVEQEDNEEGEEEEWALYYVDGRFRSALDLIDSSLLTIEREN